MCFVSRRPGRRGPRAPHTSSSAIVPAPRTPNKAAVTGSLSRVSRTGPRRPLCWGIWTEAQRTKLLARGGGHTLDSIGKALNLIQESSPTIPFTELRQKVSIMRVTRCSYKIMIRMRSCDSRDYFLLPFLLCILLCIQLYTYLLLLIYSTPSFFFSPSLILEESIRFLVLSRRG